MSMGYYEYQEKSTALRNRIVTLQKQLDSTQHIEDEERKQTFINYITPQLKGAQSEMAKMECAYYSSIGPNALERHQRSTGHWGQ